MAVLTVLALLAGACSGSDDDTDAGGDDTELSDLADLGRCPDPIVIQTDWFPQPEHGALFNLTAGQGRINAETGRFRGPLAADPEIVLEVRAGGPFLGTDSALDMMVDNDEVFLAYVNTDEAIANYERNPTTAVVAPLDINPQILMWDPEVYTIESWNDVADTDAVISHFPGVTYVDYLIDAELVDDDQLEDTYDGSPDRFIARDGTLIQQGFVTQEPYT
ncbi:MAG: ABC transporter substrate-binding protein, partial [Actinomycetota bacterium]